MHTAAGARSGTSAAARVPGMPAVPAPGRSRPRGAGDGGARQGTGDGGARQGGVLFALVGVLGLLTDFLPGTVDRGDLLPVLLDASNLTIGLIALVLPWSRLPRRSRLLLPVLAFISVAANAATGTLPIATIGVWYVLVLVWTGMWNSPRTVLAFSPLALAAYLVPFALGASQTGGAVTAVVLVIPVAVLVGVSIARKTASELARRAAEDRLSTILEGAPIALFACDREGTITFHQTSPSIVGVALYPWQAPPEDRSGGSAVGRSVFDVLRDNSGPPGTHPAGHGGRRVHFRGPGPGPVPRRALQAPLRRQRGRSAG